MSHWFALNMAWASAAMLLVLALRRPAARLFGAGIAYALWLLPALRLIVPPLPAWPAAIPAVAPPGTLVVFVEGAAAPLPPNGGSGQWMPILLAIWAGGAALFLAWQWLAYRRFLARIGTNAVAAGAHRGLPVVASPAAEGPLALGLVARRIVVPADFERRYAPVERGLALDHEAIHHRRGDIWWNHAALLMLALNWFNPIAWIAFRAFRTDQELACDAAVVATATPDARHAYARALVKSASRPGLIAACPLNHADQLKRRLKMMKDHRRSRARLFGGIGVLALIGGGALALAAPGAAQPQPPAPPAPPAPASGDGQHRERIIVRTITRDGHSETTTETIRGDGEPDDLAPPSPDGEARRRVDRVVVMTDDGHGGTTEDVHGARTVTSVSVSRCDDSDRRQTEGGDAQHRVHVFVLCRGTADATLAPARIDSRCADDNRFEVNEGTDRDRFRLILCGDAGQTPARRAEALQRVRDQLAGDGSGLSGDRKASVLARIDREIARLRAQ